MMKSQLRSIALRDVFFAPRQEIGRRTTIPSAIRRCEETGRLNAFRLQWKKGEPNQPHIYWDSDVAKILEGMAEMLQVHEDPALAETLERLIDLVIGAQRQDGYLNVYFTIVEPEKRWKNLYNWHELYCAGHLIEAAVAHFEATGSRKFLNAICRYADYINTVFGPNPGQKRGYPGHEEIELALVKLYRATGEKRYLSLAKFFLDERGTTPNYFLTAEDLSVTHATEDALVNRQAHRPVREQTRAEGHAVRALYLYSGMADVARETGDAELLNVCVRLFDNIASRRMYLTGGVGSSAAGEAFTEDYGLPNDTAYAESCASIALVFFAKRMLDATQDSKYADVMERALYNGALSGLSLSGDRFFYANPLEVNETTFAYGNTTRERRQWFGCSCCPTSYCRFLPQLGTFCYSASPELLRIDVPAAARISNSFYDVEIAGTYPYDGAMTATVRKGGTFTIALRIPAWCRVWELKVNGKSFTEKPEKGYLILNREWKSGDTLALRLEMKPGLIYSHPAVAANAGRAALICGPLVYCVESVDNDSAPSSFAFAETGKMERVAASGLPEGIPAIRFEAERIKNSSGELYSEEKPEWENCFGVAVPYAFWQNRGPSSMQVFLPVRGIRRS